MRRLALMVLPLILAACEGGGDPVDQAVREISARHQAAAVKEGTVSGPSPAAAAAPSAPNEDQAALRQMLARNQEAITAAEAVLASTTDPALRQLSQDTITARQAENAVIKSRLD